MEHNIYEIPENSWKLNKQWKQLKQRIYYLSPSCDKHPISASTRVFIPKWKKKLATEANLRNLSSLATTSLANYDSGSVSFDQIENGSTVLVNRQSLSLLLHTCIPISANSMENKGLCTKKKKKKIDGNGEEKGYPEEEEWEAEKKRTPPSSSSTRRGFSVPGFQNCDITLTNDQKLPFPSLLEAELWILKLNFQPHAEEDVSRQASRVTSHDDEFSRSDPF